MIIHISRFSFPIRSLTVVKILFACHGMPKFAPEVPNYAVFTLIPATPNVPETLVFRGFPNILFIPCVPNKRFTFRHRKPCCLWRFPLHNVTGFPFVSVCLSFPARSHRPSATCNIKLHCMLFLRSALS